MSEAATLSPEAPSRRADATPRPRRRRSLEAAKAPFARLGYDRAGLRDHLAAEAGASTSALVKRYFGGKEALFLEALPAGLVRRPATGTTAVEPRHLPARRSRP